VLTIAQQSQVMSVVLRSKKYISQSIKLADFAEIHSVSQLWSLLCENITSFGIFVIG
jgi:hypothetical protein